MFKSCTIVFIALESQFASSDTAVGCVV